VAAVDHLVHGTAGPVDPDAHEVQLVALHRRDRGAVVLVVHYALRALIHGAARDHDLDPDRISFTAALHAARRSIRTGLSETVNLASAMRRATGELLHGLLPKRRLRAQARVVRRKMSNYNVKRTQHRNWPTPSIPIESAIRVLSPP